MENRFELFVTSVNQIYRCIQKIKSREMMELGLKGPHVMCLFQLQRNPDGLTSAELSALCLEDKAAVSRAVTKLEEKGLVVFDDQGCKRRYRSRVKLTAEGRIITEKMAEMIEDAVEKGGEGLSEQERDIFYMALGIISNNLQTLCSDTKSKETSHEPH